MNGDSLQLITKNYGKLTTNEKKVADFILTHLDDTLNMSVHDLAKICNVSSATPVRLAQHIGFDGYRNFRLYLARHNPTHEDIILDLKHSDGSLRDTVEKMLASEIDSIRLTMSEMDYPLFSEISQRLKKAKRLLFFGLGSSYLVCADVASKFQRIGKVAQYTNDLTTAAVILSGFSKDDALIVISHSGETEEVIKLLKLANDNDIFTVAATTFAESTVCTLAESVIYTQTRESPLHKISLTSRISQLATMDALFMAYFNCDFENCQKNIDFASEYTKKVRL